VQPKTKDELPQRLCPEDVVRLWTEAERHGDPPNWSGPSGLLRCPAHGSRAFAQLKATDIRTDPDAGQVMRMIDKTEASTLAFHK
jgi:hypothetical protein